ncbi:MAG: HIT domain-containing protein, partial [Planctomycetota bacterium]
MHQLWAPWRAVYLKKVAQQKGCFICRAVKSGQDKKNLVLMRGQKCLVLMNLYPYNSGHLMIAPLAHQGEMEQLSAAEVQEIFDLICLMKKTLVRVLKPQGFNLGVNLGRVAGAGLPGHIHFHLVPRWNGDTNFMP